MRPRRMILYVGGTELSLSLTKYLLEVRGRYEVTDEVSMRDAEAVLCEPGYRHEAEARKLADVWDVPFGLVPDDAGVLLELVETLVYRKRGPKPRRAA